MISGLIDSADRSKPLRTNNENRQGEADSLALAIRSAEIALSGLGLVILGPERLPRVAAQVGRWVGKARRTAIHLRRQLERELERLRGESLARSWVTR